MESNNYPSQLRFGDIGLGINGVSTFDVLGISAVMLPNIYGDNRTASLFCSTGALSRLGQCYLIPGNIDVTEQIGNENILNYTLSHNGTIISGTGLPSNARLGFAATGGFNHNKDSYSDFAISTPYTNSSSGSIYIIFGNKTLPQYISLSTIDGIIGTKYEGSIPGSLTGFSLAGVTKIDGVNDGIVIGAPGANNRDGICYLVRSTSETYQATISLGSSSIGAIFIGSNLEQVGYTVMSAPNIYGNNTNAFLVGGYGSSAYLIRSSNNFPDISYLNSLNGINGTIFNAIPGKLLGSAIASTSMLGLNNASAILIGEQGQSNTDPGNAYFVLGNPAGYSRYVNLTYLNGANGTVFIGASSAKNWGTTVALADLDHNGYVDPGVCAASYANQAGACFFAFNDIAGFPPQFQLSNTTNNSVLFTGTKDFDSCRIGSAGFDVTGDDVPDAIGACPGGSDSYKGTVYITPGRDKAAPSASPTPSNTPSQTPSQTPTSSITPTASITASRTPSNTASQTASVTATPTPTPTSYIDGINNLINQLYTQQKQAAEEAERQQNIVKLASSLPLSIISGLTLIFKALSTIRQYKQAHTIRDDEGVVTHVPSSIEAIQAGIAVGLVMLWTVGKGAYKCVTCRPCQRRAANKLTKIPAAAAVGAAKLATTVTEGKEGEDAGIMMLNPAHKAHGVGAGPSDRVAHSPLQVSRASTARAALPTALGATILADQASKSDGASIIDTIRDFLLGSQENDNIDDQICDESEAFDEFGNSLYPSREADQLEGSSTKSAPSEEADEDDVESDEESEEPTDQSKKVEADAKTERNKESANQPQEANNGNPEKDGKKATQLVDTPNTQAEGENTTNNIGTEEILAMECFGECAAAAA